MAAHYILSVLLLITAALFKAAADRMRNTYSISVFASFKKPLFFDAVKSFKDKKLFNYPIDGWHISNTLMIASFCAGSFFYQPLTFWVVKIKWLSCFFDLCFYALIFNLHFNLFYDKILLQRKYWRK